MTPLQDNFGRQFSYLRLSVTDLCNFRCGYCLPNGCQVKDRDFLTLAEIRRLVTAFAQSGIKKIRLTGGEPTVRRDLIKIITQIRHTAGIEQLALTTNGYCLAQQAENFYQAGLDSINVSIDSLNPVKFHRITGHNKLAKILTGIDRAQAIGFKKIKVNVVLLKTINDDEVENFLEWAKESAITVRFLELMQTGNNRAYFNKHHLSTDGVKKRLLLTGWQQQKRALTAGPAMEFSHPDYLGRIGVISPYSKNFCTTCNRLRVSARGALHLCLFAETGYALRSLLQHDEQQAELTERIAVLLNHKTAAHSLHQGMTGITTHLATIGG
ncbi:MAG: GTP 3',8-cyclase MoaA [Gammaproteobacteria bacterium]|nr:GTP 3',8-cyclase MoaA [Gammaproteobacteria bacterium]